MARWRIGLGKAIPLLIFGLIFLATTVYVSFLNKPYADGATATGTVTAVTETTTTSNNRTRTYYGRVVTYDTRNGRTITFDAEGMLSDTAPEVGEKVKVSYEPGNPERARVIIAVRALDTWFQRLLILGSALMTLAGLNAIVWRFARRRAEQPR